MLFFESCLFKMGCIRLFVRSLLLVWQAVAHLTSPVSSFQRDANTSRTVLGMGPGQQNCFD